MLLPGWARHDVDSLQIHWPLSKRTVFYPYIINPLLFLNFTSKLWIVFQSNVSYENVFGMLTAGANGGTLVELQKGALSKEV